MVNKETLEAPYSHYLLDTKLSQEIDRRTIKEMNIDGFTLMEIAGSSAAKKILGNYTDLTHGVYFCGKGNNGGDALVIARYLIQNNIKATVVFLGGTENLSSDAQKNFELLKRFDSQNIVSVVRSWDDFNTPPTNFDFVVDGMLGTGLDSEIRGDYTHAVGWINDQSTPCFAVDIPTGLNADTGQVMGCAVDAERTFAFGSRKLGFYLKSGPSLTGSVEYCELPFPNQYKRVCKTYLLDEHWVQADPPSPGNHKYESGVLYMVAGSEGLTGAAIMAAQSAWAEGLGAVVLICPRALLPIYEQNLPAIIKKPVGSREDYFFKDDHTDDVLDIIGEKDGLVLLGPGMGRDPSTVTFVKQFISQTSDDLVVDADGLWCLSQLEDWQKPDGNDWILTPHPGELKALIQQKISEPHERLEAVRKYAQQKNVTLLSKGMPGIIGTPEGKCYLTNYDTRYFARAGSGDVLAGKVSAFKTFTYSSGLSCALALLNGQHKLNTFLQQNRGLPEPKDFI